ncbi:type I glyceraldehyde-3-phosphate dehydrogenase [bacterium]|nr:MAG: type I glyceraldehyde-3-phosphate dehydrogenase [bacterium]
MAIRVAINGFGRIGRSLFRILLSNPDAEIVAVNDLCEERILAHLLRYDSFHGRFDCKIEHGQGWLSAGGQKLTMIRQPRPEGLPWKELGVDLVVEATGAFTTGGDARKHLLAGAQSVLISAPSDDADVTIVLGVNQKDYNAATHKVVSAASCTTNCLTPVVYVLDKEFGVQKGLVTTVHSYTNDQNLLDHPHADLRRARSAAVSIIPTTTGAARAVEKVLPKLKGRLDGVSVRVPTADISLADITLLLGRKVTAKEVNSALLLAAHGELNGILGFSDEPLVSVDYRGCPFSAVVDSLQTRVVDGDMIKVSAWYDNEWGYANRLSEVVGLMAGRQFIAGDYP